MITLTAPEATRSGVDRLARAGPVRACGALWGRALHRTLLWRSRPLPAPTSGARTLVIAPHPDDETLGCGATIASRVAAGVGVTVLIVSNGEHSHDSEVLSPEELAIVRRREATEACSRLGVEDVRFLGLGDRTLESRVDAITSALRAVIDEVRPDEVMVPAAIDAHADHRAVNASARRALAIRRSDVRVLEYPVWFWTPSAWVDADASTTRQIAQLASRPLRAIAGRRPLRAEGRHDVKVHALDAYRSQTTNLTGEEGWATLDASFLAHFVGIDELFFPWRGEP